MRRLLLACVWAGACSTTQVASTWQRPGAELSGLRRVAVLAQLDDAAIRRNTEEQLARALGGRLEAVPAYLLAGGETTRGETLRAAVEAGGFDAVLALRITAVDRDAEWIPGAWVGRYYDFSGWTGYQPLYPEYVQVDTAVRVETNLYALPSRELLWSASTRTREAGALPRLLDETVEAVSEALLAAAAPGLTGTRR